MLSARRSNTSSAAEPSVAVSTRYPCSTSTRRAVSRISGWSSTSRIVSAPALATGSLSRERSTMGAGLARTKVAGYRGADVPLAADLYRAAMLRHQPVDGREAETGAAAPRFGREEGLEAPSKNLVAHAVTVVADRESHSLTVARRPRDHLDGDDPAVRHGVASVGAEVDDDLPNSADVGMNARRRLDAKIDGDRLGKQTPQRGSEVSNELTEVDGAEGQHLLAAESEQLANELGAVARPPR